MDKMKWIRIQVNGPLVWSFMLLGTEYIAPFHLQL